MEDIMKPIDEFNGMLAQTFLPIFGLEVPEKKEGEGEKKDSSKDAAKKEKGPFDDLPFFNLWKEQSGADDGQAIYAVGMCIQKTGGKADGTGKKFEVLSVDPDCEPFKLGVRKGDTLHQVGIIETKALTETELSELIQHTLSLGEKLRLIFKQAEANKKGPASAKGTLEILVEDHTREAAAAGGKREEVAESPGGGEYV